jgi:glutathione-specific gamma-glutamylcyclotransferase
MQQCWVFAYGSLMWNPGFKFLSHGPARLAGYHRKLCVLSYHYRGTQEKPGLVLGLDRGGECKGVAYLVDGTAWDQTHAYLTARERISEVYDEMLLPVELASGETVEAMAYVVNLKHPQYAGCLEPRPIFDHITQGHGLAGACLDYVRNTIAHLRGLGIRDDHLELLAGEYPELQAASVS